MKIYFDFIFHLGEVSTFIGRRFYRLGEIFTDFAISLYHLASDGYSAINDGLRSEE